jgi:hypothetical protein
MITTQTIKPTTHDHHKNCPKQKVKKKKIIKTKPKFNFQNKNPNKDLRLQEVVFFFGLQLCIHS